MDIYRERIIGSFSKVFLLEILQGLFDLFPELSQVDDIFSNHFLFNLPRHILALLNHQLASLMILLGLFDILGVSLLVINLADFGLHPRNGCGFPLVNCFHGLFVVLNEFLACLFELSNQGTQVGYQLRISLLCSRAESLSFCLRSSLNGCASVQGRLVGEVRLRVVKVQLRRGDRVALVRLQEARLTDQILARIAE